MTVKLPWVERGLRREGGAPGKVTTLSEAIRSHVKPRQSIQVGEKPSYPLGYPFALLYEIIRQYHRKDPRFTIITFGGNAVNLAPLVHGGMVEKVITSFLGDPYPAPSPNPILQEAYAQKKLAVEEWSMLTLTLRLLAGAMDLPFFPTKSLRNSSMAENNPHLHLYKDPFENSEVSLIRALKPDICLVHGWLADEQGNTVINLPLGGNVYGPLASRNGVIVSAERIVSTEEILQYREHIRIPGAIVKAVVEAPFGSHPSGHPRFPQRGEAGYAEDKDFILQSRRVCRDQNAFNEWMEHWILNCRDHRDYLRKLGHERLVSLKGRDHASTWQTQLMEDDFLQKPAEPSAEEKMIVIAARQIKKSVLANDFDFILTGVGASHLASWLAYYLLLEEEGRRVTLMTESGLYGYVPVPGDPFLFSNRNVPTAELYSDIFNILGIMVQGTPGRCLGVLGGAQVDCRGNINSTKIPRDSLYLVGSGGANDVASGASAVIAVVKQNKRRYREEVDFITSPGERVKTLVSQHGVYQKEEKGKFRLTGYMESPGIEEAEIVRQIRAQCDWDLEAAPELSVIPRPTAEEINRLRYLDPDGYFRGTSP